MRGAPASGLKFRASRGGALKPSTSHGFFYVELPAWWSHKTASQHHFMKTTILLVALAGLLGLSAGCKPSNRVMFNPARMSVDPGVGWVRMDIPAALPACTPRLMSKVGMINAVFLEDITDIKQAANQMQTSFSHTSGAVPESFKQEDFTTDSGLTGVHLSYTAKSVNSNTPEMRSHSFITHNLTGKCVSISYITSPDVESAAVLEAIRKTLRVE
jgi:hypothetical protein